MVGWQFMGHEQRVKTNSVIQDRYKIHLFVGELEGDVRNILMMRVGLLVTIT